MYDVVNFNCVYTKQSNFFVYFNPSENRVYPGEMALLNLNFSRVFQDLSNTPFDHNELLYNLNMR